MDSPPARQPEPDPSAAEPVKILPQFSLGEILLVMGEVGVCLTLWRLPGSAVLTPVFFALTCLLLHVTRGKVLRGVFFGIVVGALLLIPLSAMRPVSESAWTMFHWGLLLAATGAMYGGALQAVFMHQRLPVVPLLILLLATLYLLTTCLYLATW